MAVKTQKISRKINSRAKTGKCLLCDRVAKRRGLCDPHYTLFRKRQGDCGGAKDQAQFEIDCIEGGKILPQQAIRKIKNEDPFAGSKKPTRSAR